MERYRFSLGEVPPLGYKTTLCLGNFDGLHRGHQALISQAKRIAEGDVAVLLFDSNPSDWLENGKSHRVLTSLEDKARLLSSWGVDILYVIHIDELFFALSPLEFIERILVPLAPSALVVGEDYTFGKKALGKPALLETRFHTLQVPLMTEDGKKISTQGIIHAIEKGEVTQAEMSLGRPYEIVGTVTHGLGNGRKLGFPTANLALSAPYVLPKSGVYLGLAYLRGVPHKALVNVGNNPTIGALKDPIVESYLDSLDEDVYGETLYVAFLSRIRDEMRFSSLKALQEQMKKDMTFLR